MKTLGYYLNSFDTLRLVIVAGASEFLAHTTPIHPFIFLVFALVFADFITGLIKAKKLKVKVERNKMWKTVYKLLSACLLLYCAMVFQDTFGFGKVFTYTAALIVCSAELQSLAENAGAIWEVDIWGALRKLIRK